MSRNDKNTKIDLNEELPPTNVSAGIEGIGVGERGEPGVKKFSYKKKNEKTTLCKLKATLKNGT